MSIVIIGGNECMVCQYETICKKHGYRAKIFVKQHGVITKKIGVPDLIVLFMNTVSHSLVQSALTEAKKNNIPVCRCSSGSAAALQRALAERGGAVCAG